MTKSPVSTCGVNVGLCLPRSTFATSAANLPTVWPSASTTYHLRSTLAAFAMNVVFTCISLPVQFSTI